jgi:LCP family protein required for cell wall assembly
MSDTPDMKHEARSGHSAERASDHRTEPRPRRRGPWRVALVTLGSLLGLAIVTVIGGYAYVNHVLSSIPRVSVAHLAAAESSGETFLITAAPWGATGTPVQVTSPPSYSKLVMLLHINASGHAGGAVTIPGDTMVNVPGAGTEPLWDALKTGGPSLLVQTVRQLTGVPINHYARIDFNHISSFVNAIGGVDVTLPDTSTSFGHTFSAGVNHLTGVTAIYYARDPSLSDESRLLRQESFIRAVLTKIANDHLVTNPLTMVRVLNAITSALTMDSNMTNSGIESLAMRFGRLGGNAATFVTAPTRTTDGELVLEPEIAGQLWTAIKQDSIANFAGRYPSAVTPHTVP